LRQSDELAERIEALEGQQREQNTAVRGNVMEQR